MGSAARFLLAGCTRPSRRRNREKKLMLFPSYTRSPIFVSPPFSSSLLSAAQLFLSPRSVVYSLLLSVVSSFTPRLLAHARLFLHFHHPYIFDPSVFFSLLPFSTSFVSYFSTSSNFLSCSFPYFRPLTLVYRLALYLYMHSLRSLHFLISVSYILIFA